MKKFLKWTGIVIASLAVILFIALQDNGTPALVLSWEKTKVVVPFE
jgi:hypothetical protein